MSQGQDKNMSDDWQKPFSLTDNLESSVKSLTSTNTILNSTLHSLRLVTKEFTRQCELTKHNRAYDLVTEQDIKRAQSDTLKDIQPEIDELFSEAQLLLTTLREEENQITIKLDIQARYLEDIKLTLRNLQSNTFIENAKNIRDNNSNNSHNKKKRTLDLNTNREFHNKRNRIEKLVELNDIEDKKIFEQSRDLKELQKTLLETEKQMESSVPGGTKIDLENSKNRLERELINLREISIHKRSKYDDQFEGDFVSGKFSETLASNPANHTITEYIEQYSSTLATINEILPQIKTISSFASMAVVSTCIAQSKRYLQSLKNEKSHYQKPNDSVWHADGLEQIKKLQKALFPYGKTTGNFLGLLLANRKMQIQVEELVNEFPPEKEKRHNIQKALIILLEANVLTLDSGYITIKK